MVNHQLGHTAIDADVLTRDEASLVAAKNFQQLFLEDAPNDVFSILLANNIGYDSLIAKLICPFDYISSVNQTIAIGKSTHFSRN